MSKVIRKNAKSAAATTTVADERQIRAEDAQQAKLDSRAHEFTDQQVQDLSAPLGTERSTASQVSGTTVFDVVDELSSVGQITALRAMANGAICTAVFIANDYLSYDGPRQDTGGLIASEIAELDRWERLPARMTQQTDLYGWAAARLQVLSSGRYDNPMTLGEAIEFAATSAGLNRGDDTLPDEVLEALGMSRAELAVIDAEERRKQALRDQALRSQVRSNAGEIAGELGSMIDVLHATDDVLDSFVADQHVALYRKVARKLSARMAQLLGMRGRYDGAIGDAMLVSADVRTVDKAMTQFLRANEGELSAR